MTGMSHNQSVGKKGEIIAIDYLKAKGYELICANYRAGRGEIDIIAVIEDILVFVEVKTRTNLHFGFPELAVTQKKTDKLMETAEAYIAQTNWAGPIRFDIISIDLQKQYTVTHFEDAFH